MWLNIYIWLWYHTKDSIQTEWKGKTPAFLFRGWKPSSGGNPKLNTTDAVTPHAFHGSHREESDTPISELPKSQIKSEIEGHLNGSLVNSHFSSWAADFQTAVKFAGVGNNAHIAIFDTSLKGQHNEIYHVSALRTIGLCTANYPDEYLVYGPVTGEGYACVPVRRLRDHGMDMTVASRSSTSRISVKELKHAEKIANEFQSKRHMEVKRPALYLTVFAAELGRLLRASQGSNCGLGWSQEDNRKVLTHLSALGILELAAKQPYKKPLVNPKTYVNGFPQLKAMVDILMTLELEIDRKRSEISRKSSSKTTIVSSASGKKRKADGMQASKDSKTTQIQLHSLGDLETQAQLLRAKLVAMKEKLETFKAIPKRNTLNDTTNCMESAPSYPDRLVKWAQDFNAELHRAEAALQSLHVSCDELIESVDAAKDKFACPDPRKSHHASSLSTANPLVQEDCRKLDLLHGIPGPKKRRKQKNI